MNEKINNKGGRVKIGQENSTNTSFLCYLSKTVLQLYRLPFTVYRLPFFSLPRPWAIDHMDRKSETHWVGWTIAWGCLSAGKDTSIRRTVHSMYRKSQARAFAVYVVKVGTLTRSALCMDCRPGRPCTSYCSPFRGLRDRRSWTSFAHSALSWQRYPGVITVQPYVNRNPSRSLPKL